jgi:hypothetical protein
MQELGYIARSSEAHIRNRMGERQKYCAHCKLCCWPEEQASCHLFTVDHELETFYDNEEKKSQEVKPKRKRKK